MHLKKRVNMHWPLIGHTFEISVNRCSYSATFLFFLPKLSVKLIGGTLIL